MKKFLIIAGVLIIIACVLSLFFAFISIQSYHSLRDGSADLYNRLHSRGITFSVVGGILGVIGSFCLIIQSKM